MSDADFNVYATIKANTAQFEKGMKNAQASVNLVSKGIEGVQKLLKTAFSIVGISVGIKAIADFGKSCVQSANEASKAFNILDNTVRATGADAWTSTEKLVEASKTLSDSTNYSVTEIQKMQSVLLGFTNITGEAFDGASDAVLDMATVMGMDLTSAVQTVGKALDDPITGLDSLRRQGFKFTDEQKAELAQLVKNGKQLEAQKIILDTLATSYGGASKAGQDSFAKLRHSMDAFQEDIGNKLMPVISSLADNMSKTMSKITDIMNSTEFDKFINALIWLFNQVKNILSNIKEYFSRVFTEIKGIVTSVNFSPFIKILDTLVGIVRNLVEEIKSNARKVEETFGTIKTKMDDFTQIVNVDKIVNIINTVIDVIWFLRDELKEVATQIRDLVTNLIGQVWEKIKEIFNNSNEALKDSETNIKSWGDYFYTIFDSVFKIAQNLVGSISAILHGDWEVAWQHGKLVVLRIADIILDSVSTVINAFPKLISKLTDELNKWLKRINKVREWLGKEPIEPFGEVKTVDLAEKAGITKSIKDAEDKIKELTGKTANIALKDLEGISNKSAGLFNNLVTTIQKSTEEIDSASQKTKQSWTGTINNIEDNGESTYKKFSEWDSKLLQQRLEDLDEWSDEYHEVQLALIEQEKKKAEDADKTGAETEKINAYYNKQIEKENERSEKAKRDKVKETMKIVLSTISNIAKKTVEVFKKVVSTIKDVFNSITNIVKNIADAFSKLFEFNPDEALDSLLAIEDAILTFFIETLPKLPNFFETSFSSVLNLINTLINSIDWEKIKGILTSIIQTFTTYVPGIIQGITNLFMDLVSTISSVLVENAPEIVHAIGAMFFTVLEALPGLISNFLNVAGTYLSEIGKYITDNGERLSEDLSKIIKSIVDGISNFIESGGWRNILSALLTIQNAIQTAITDNLDEIVNVIIEALPDLVDMLIKSIVSASKAMEKVIKPIIRLVLAVIEAIIDVLLSDEVLDAGIEAGFAIMDAIFEELVPKLAYLIPKLIVKIIGFIVKNIPKIVGAMVDGLVKSFVNFPWVKSIQEMFKGFIDGIKSFFGIHSPSTVFEEFGGYMIEGLWEGIKNFGSWLWQNVSSFFTSFVDGIKNIFSNVGDWFKDIFSNAGKGITDAFNGIGSWFNDVGNNIKSAFTGIGDWFKNIFSGAVTNIKNAFDGIGNWFSGIWGNIKNGLSNVGDWFKNTFSGAVSNIKNAFLNIGSWAGGIWGNIKNGFSNVGTWFKSAFDGAVTNIKSAFDGIGNWFGNVVKDIKNAFNGIGNWFSNTFSSIGNNIQSFANEAIANLKSVGDKANELLSKDNSSTESHIAKGALAVLTGGISAIFTGFATGTQNAPRGLAMVGEAGPELVNFRGGEQVLNAGNTQKALEGMGGTVVNQNVTFNNLQDTTAFAMLQQLKQYNRQMAINGII